MYRKIIFSAAITLAMATAAVAAGTGQPAVTLDTITVTEKLVSPTRQAGDLLHTGSQVTAAGIALTGSDGRSSIFRALDLLPGINTELQDPLGIAGKDVQIRGTKGRFAGMALEGLPNYGIMPIGPRDDIYDLENLEAAGLYKGAAPLSLGTGSGNRGGTVALTYRRPAATFKLDCRQQLGNDNARRSFFRLDSGLLPAGTSFFVSGSRARAEKWKGSGDLGPRDHVNIGVSQPLGKSCNLELFYNYNDVERHDFKPLTYAEADRIEDTYKHDYNRYLTGNGAVDVNYYDYHRSDCRNHDLLTILSCKPGSRHFLTFKPYYSSEKGKTLDGKADKVRDLERYGITTEYRGQFGGCNLTAGYWFESHDLKKYVRANAITAAGRIYSGWKYLTENHGNGHINSPYLQLGRRFGRCSCQAGMKYFSYTEPASTAYRGSAAAGTPYAYDDALDHNQGEDAALSLDKMTYDAWLPSLAVGFQVDPRLELYANYGRNYMRPYAYVPVANIYAANRARFLAAGMTLQDIIDDWKMETSDNIDLGARYYGDWFDLQPTLFFARHHDLLSIAYDPRVGVNYHQNLGDATAMGVEVELNLYPAENLLVFFNPSYTRMRFDDDLEKGGTTMAIKGNQLPDTPELLVKTGVVFTLGRLEITPIFKYVGRRYGDPENDKSISAHGLVDLNLRYTRDEIFFLRKVSVGLAISNLCNEKYVGGIVAKDDGSGNVYYAGAPLATVFSFRAVF